MKSGSLNSLEPSGPAQACYRRTVPFTYLHNNKWEVHYFNGEAECLLWGRNTIFRYRQHEIRAWSGTNDPKCGQTCNVLWTNPVDRSFKERSLIISGPSAVLLVKLSQCVTLFNSNGRNALFVPYRCYACVMQVGKIRMLTACNISPVLKQYQTKSTYFLELETKRRHKDCVLSHIAY